MSPATFYNVNKNKAKKFNMGSKRMKRKKLRCKRLEKFYKLKAKEKQFFKLPKKSIFFESRRENDCERKNIRGYRLRRMKCSRSYIEQKNISDVKYFAKVREDYFRHLQTVICNNCELFDSTVTKEMLEDLALELEQDALLACLQVEAYKRSMCNIIEAINKSTREKQIHKNVKRLLSDSFHKRTHQPNSPKFSANPSDETYKRIPTTASTRAPGNSEGNNVWRNESIYNMEYYSMKNNCKENYFGDQNNLSVQSWEENQISSKLTQTNNWIHESPQTSKSNSKISQNIISSHSPNSQNNLNNLKNENCPLSYIPSNSEENLKKVDPLSFSRNQLQKLVEQTLNETEEINRQKRDEQERACIAQILEGDDNLDERFNDSLSDNENESKENIDDSNLMDRLEKMRELFGMEEEEEAKNQTEVIPEKPKQNCKGSYVQIHSRRPSIWKYEKFIQLHKYSIIGAEMSFERRQINQNLFVELFGEDSDEEHEAEYSSAEKYRLSCTERISSWVVKHLMPFYNEKRILGRNIFKSLGHYISETIVDEIQYPDEWTVKYYVSKFFPPKKKYICDADILNFHLD